MISCVFIAFTIVTNSQPYVSLGSNYSKIINSPGVFEQAVGGKASAGCTFIGHLNVGAGYSYKQLFPNIMKNTLSTAFTEVQYNILSGIISPYIGLSAGYTFNKLVIGETGIEGIKPERTEKGYYLGSALGISIKTESVKGLCFFAEISYDNYSLDQHVNLLGGNVGVKYSLAKNQ